jgi:GH24 family phage-related lysozyme (muramidase)
MPIQYSPFPEFQVPNVNILGALAQGQASAAQELQAQKLAQATDIAALKAAQDAENARLKQQADELDFAVKNANIFKDRVMQIPPTAPDAQARYDALLKEFQPKAPSLLGGLPSVFDADTQRNIVTSHDDFMKVTAPKERDTMVGGKVGKATFIFDPYSQTERMVGGSFQPGARDLVEVKDKDGNIIGVREKGSTEVQTLTLPGQAVAPTAAAPTGEGVPGPRGAAVGTQLTRKFEGFIPTAKFDVDAERVGYGSSTTTTPEGKVVTVTKGTKTTQEDAERDLKRRIETEFIPKAAAQVGQENWDRLPENVAGALTSVTYNYGSLPNKVAAAVKTGNVNAIANAVEALADDNKGINRGRRMSEAATIRGSEMPGTAAVPSFAAAPPPAALGMSPQIQPPINMMAGGAMPIQNAMAMPAPTAAPMTVAEFAKMPLKQKNTEFFKGLLTSYEDQERAGILPTKEEGRIARGKKIAMANIPSAVARTLDPAGQELRDISINKIDQYINMLREQGTLTGGEANTVAELEAKKKMLGASDLTIDAIRKIVVDLDKQFGTGTIKAEGGATAKGVTVNVPGMGAVSFPSQEAADAFRREAGL